ncbi:GerMN domain-containing protein [Arcanobacterium hippocoleae]|uniref:GerMN domain-containing protein n=1 Tax=Arcanobacterium hippocoleae TaxID=149017 RepID=UPI00333F3FC0
MGLTDNFQAARQFLTADMARKWDPLSAVRIYPDTQSYSSSQTPAGAYRVSVPTIGSVDADGIYTPASKESQLTNEFSLIRNPDGEWRIAVLDDGMMMSRALFNSLYIEAPLYFPSHIGKDLVADVRWYPRQGLVSSIARGIAKGPAKWISPAVRVVMPPDVLVSGSQVRSSDSVAVVDLSANATALPQETIMILQAQYRHSFSAAGVAQDVIITASGVQISGESQIDLQTYALQDSPLVGIQDGSVVRISRNKQQILPVMPSEIIKSLGLRDLTLAYGESLSFGSALDDSGSTLYRLDFSKRQCKAC